MVKMLVCPRCNTTIPKGDNSTVPHNLDSFHHQMASCSLQLAFPPCPPHATLYLPGMHSSNSHCGLVCSHGNFPGSHSPPATGCSLQAQFLTHYPSPLDCHQQFYYITPVTSQNSKCLLQTSGGCTAVINNHCGGNFAFNNFHHHNNSNNLDKNILNSCKWTLEDDKKVRAANKAALEQCGWYHGAISSVHADSLLSKCPEGTFLIRDSSIGEGKYALSIKTPKGPTSSRIEYEMGKYFLSCDDKLKLVTPRFSGILELVEYYMEMGKKGKMISQIWIDSEGKPVSTITIKTPLRKEVPSLQHLSRLAINNSTSVNDNKKPLTDLPKNIKDFISAYPHKC